MNGLPMYPGTRVFSAPFVGTCDVDHCRRHGTCVQMDVDNGNCTDKPFERWSMVLCVPHHKAEALRVAQRDGNHVFDHDGTRLAQGRLLNRAEVAAIRDRFASSFSNDVDSADRQQQRAVLCPVCGGTGRVPPDRAGPLCVPCQGTGIL